MPNRMMFALRFVAALLISSGATVQAQVPNWYAGSVTWLEVWKSGNVAFRLDAANPPCNGQFVINKSDPGFKNLYAALIAARLAERPITVYAAACVAAEGYGGNYASVEYLYP